jgi:hypothetical protein
MSSREETSSFPHKEITIGLGVAAAAYCLYSVTSSLFFQHEKSLKEEIAAKAERIRQLEEYYNNPDSNNTHHIQPLDELNLRLPRSNYSAPSTPTLDGAVAADDCPSVPCTPPPHKPGAFSSRQSIVSQPPSPKTHGVLEKLDSLNGEHLWYQLDPDGDRMVSKSAVLTLIAGLEDLKLFLDSLAAETINTPTLMTAAGTHQTPKEALLQRVVDKLAGKNNQYVSYERWKKFMKGGTFDPLHIDSQIDGVD